ncbi:MBL fold metallo-hydrolase [Streptomyces sp. cg40]|uniref:MBL fold metallo-hydrolase n=1 Tax=Streptomyces sp. cg40 TaxID=3419764 RepID=UPI003D04F142
MRILRLYLGSMSGTALGPAAPFYAYAVVHRDGVVLVDTGFGTMFGGAEAAGELRYGDMRCSWVRRTAVEALADHGIEPAEVSIVVNTHLGDHSGDNCLFPHARFVVRAAEVAWHRAGHAPLAEQSRPAWDFPGARLEQLGPADTEILPGITCLSTPGHTPGHQSVLVEADGERSLIVGDAFYTTDLWRNPERLTQDHPFWDTQIQMADGADLWRSSAARLISLNPTTVYFAHDHRRSTAHQEMPATH